MYKGHCWLKGSVYQVLIWSQLKWPEISILAFLKETPGYLWYQVTSTERVTQYCGAQL